MRAHARARVTAWLREIRRVYDPACERVSSSKIKAEYWWGDCHRRVAPRLPVNIPWSRESVTFRESSIRRSLRNRNSAHVLTLRLISCLRDLTRVFDFQFRVLPDISNNRYLLAANVTSVLAHPSPRGSNACDFLRYPSFFLPSLFLFLSLSLSRRLLDRVC